MPPFRLASTDVSYRMGWDASLPLLQYGPRFHKQRRLITDHFTRDLRSFRQIQRSEAYVFLLGLVETPDAFLQHIRRYCGSRIVYISRLTLQKKVCGRDYHEDYIRPYCPLN